jgi:tetratricopeptide (TPR) repeat protein
MKPTVTRFLFISFVVAGFLVFAVPSPGEVAPTDLEGKGPPEPSLYSGMSWKVLLGKANQMYEIADLDKAVEYAAQLIKTEPNIPGGWRVSGLVKSDRRDFEGAEKDLRRCIDLTETYFGRDVKSLQYDYEALAYVLKRRNRLDEAIETYKKSVAVNPREGYYIDQLILACQWKYAQKYAKLDGKIFLESELRPSYQLSELAEEQLIIREFRHSDGGRWAMEEQKISITGATRIDHVTLSCERCKAVKSVTFNISFGPDNAKRLEEVVTRYGKALEDKDADIRTFAASRLKLLEESRIAAMSKDPDPWVRLATLRFIQVNKPEMKYLGDFLADSDKTVSRFAAAVAKSISNRQPEENVQE